MAAKKSKNSNQRKPQIKNRNTTSNKTIVSTSKTAPRKKTARSRQKAQAQQNLEMPFSKMNYILLVAGILTIGLGFFLMSLEDFVDASQFSIALYIAPIVVVGGFVEIIFAIMYTPKEGDDRTEKAAVEEQAVLTE